MLCVLTGAYCTEGDCPLYHDATLQCKFVMAIENILGGATSVKAKKPRHDPSSTEGVIEKILSLKPNLTREAVERLIGDEMAKAAGLLTEQAAAHLVAANLGLDRAQPSLIPAKIKSFPELEGQWLDEITGEVVGNLDTREVETTNGRTLITNFGLTDGVKTIRVGVWGELGDNLRLKAGDLITLTRMKIGQPYEGTEQISSTRNTKVK